MFWQVRSDGRLGLTMVQKAMRRIADARTRPTRKSASGMTGHNEVVRAVVYDPAVVCYEDALWRAVLGGARPDPGHAPGQQSRRPVWRRHILDDGDPAGPAWRRLAALLCSPRRSRLQATGRSTPAEIVPATRGVLMAIGRGLRSAIRRLSTPFRQLRRRLHGRGRMPNRRCRRAGRGLGAVALGGLTALAFARQALTLSGDAVGPILGQNRGAGLPSWADSEAQTAIVDALIFAAAYVLDRLGDHCGCVPGSCVPLELRPVTRSRAQRCWRASPPSAPAHS